MVSEDQDFSKDIANMAEPDIRGIKSLIISMNKSNASSAFQRSIYFTNGYGVSVSNDARGLFSAARLQHDGKQSWFDGKSFGESLTVEQVAGVAFDTAMIKN